MNTSSVYSQPRNKSMEAATFFKRQQRFDADEYEAFYGKTAPAWMRASIEDIARHIDMIFDAARDCGVQLKWQKIEYGSTWQQICEAAKAKQSYKYTVGDYLPREAKRLDSFSKDDAFIYQRYEYVIRNYHGTYYITVNDCVVGFFHGETRKIGWTNDNLTRHDIFAIRFGSYDEAKAVFKQITT